MTDSGGIINVYKEPGFTSFDVIAILRRLLGIKKIGHTGTLDPMAEGVLPVCVGKATKVCSLITDWDKSYETVLRLGLTTDTLDVTGEVTHAAGAGESLPGTEEIKEAILSFEGGYEQMPPMYSAKKQQGRKLYELARAGVVVERKKAAVKICGIRIHEFITPDRVRFSMSCSKGTYIRSLCDDIGRLLGCGGCMESLKRTRVGPFTIENALTLREIEERLKAGDESFFDPTDSVFGDLKKVCIDDRFLKALLNGNRLPAESIDARLSAGEEIRVCLPGGDFAAIYRREEADYRPVRMFI